VAEARIRPLLRRGDKKQNANTPTPRLRRTKKDKPPFKPILDCSLLLSIDIFQGVTCKIFKTNQLKIDKNEKNRKNSPVCWKCGFWEIINGKTMGRGFYNHPALWAPLLEKEGGEWLTQMVCPAFALPLYALALLTSYLSLLTLVTVD